MRDVTRSLSVRHRLGDAEPFVLPGEAFSHFQTALWARLLTRYGQTSLWLGAFDGERVVATWLLYETCGDYLNPPRLKFAHRWDRHLRAVHSPVFAPSTSRDQQRKIAAALLQYIGRLDRERGYVSVSLSLDPGLDGDSALFWRGAAVDAGFDAHTIWTYLASLPQSAEDLSGAIKSDRRTKIRKAEQAGVHIEEGTDDAIVHRYSEVRADGNIRNGHKPVPESFYRVTRDALAGSGVFRLFVASLGDRVGAGQQVFAHRGYVYLAGVSVADWVYREKIPANDLLQWRVMNWAVETGQRIVDFGGAQPQSEDPKMQGIDAFKSRWGTTLKESLSISRRGPWLRRAASALVQAI